MSERLCALDWWRQRAMGFEYTEHWKKVADQDGLCLIAVKGPGNTTPEDGPDLNYTDMLILYDWLKNNLGEEHYVVEINKDQSWILFSTASDAVLWKFEWDEHRKKELALMGRIF